MFFLKHLNGIFSVCSRLQFTRIAPSIRRKSAPSNSSIKFKQLLKCIDTEKCFVIYRRSHFNGEFIEKLACFSTLHNNLFGDTFIIKRM